MLSIPAENSEVSTDSADSNQDEVVPPRVVLGQHDYNERNFFFLPAVISPCGAHTQRIWPCASSSTLSPSGPARPHSGARDSIFIDFNVHFRVSRLRFRVYASQCASGPTAAGGPRERLQRRRIGSPSSGGHGRPRQQYDMYPPPQDPAPIAAMVCRTTAEAWTRKTGERESGGERWGEGRRVWFVRVCAHLCAFVHFCVG